jgi:Molybdopterin cofactor-binding domain
MPDHDVFDHESAASRSAKPRCGKGELEPPHAVSLGPGHIGAIRLWYPPFADEVGTDGEVRVHRIICAIDCGVAVNPEMIAAQVEGETLFGLTAALYGQITLKNERVEQGNFHDYRSMRMNEAPSIETYLVKSSEAPGGFGEAPTAAIAPVALPTGHLTWRAAITCVRCEPA